MAILLYCKMITCPHFVTVDSLGCAWGGWAGLGCKGADDSFGWVWRIVVVRVIVIVIVVVIVVERVVEIGSMGSGDDGDGGNGGGEMVLETRGRG